MTPGTLYLLPCPIGDGAPVDVLPAANFEVMRGLDYFIVENVRSARRFLSRAGVASQNGGRSIDSLTFVELNEHTRPEEIGAMLAPVVAGRSAGVISEAGVPAVADPGADIVAAAHRAGVRVVPLVGPSSVLMALMASGANGQSFAFNGYLPVREPDRGRAIRRFEQRARAERQSQIFIETPYRGGRLFADLLSACAPETRLTVAADITAPGEFIRTLPVAEWRKTPAPPLDKRPAIFILN
ncbi:MAG: SAM-dependent methyltransferase [Alistipes sp.]|jgi:16S rRNA (cytidine1402-2'-O)-methyltransferase|nr:SAM-dependent methyltransferase [Alistipes sp.]